MNEVEELSREIETEVIIAALAYTAGRYENDKQADAIYDAFLNGATTAFNIAREVMDD